jgi:hypothetical protein
MNDDEELESLRTENARLVVEIERLNKALIVCHCDDCEEFRSYQALNTKCNHGEDCKCEWVPS